MNTKLIQNGILITLAPVVTIVLACIFGESMALQIVITALGMAAQLMIVRYCKKDMKKLTRPDRAVVKAMNLGQMVFPYEPERLKWDLRICSAMSWLGVLCPLSVLIARWSNTLVVKQGAWLTTAEVIVLVGLGLALASTVFYLVWCRMDQAVQIWRTGSEKHRYELRAFAEELNRPGGYAHYLAVVHPEKNVRPRYETN